MTSTSLMPLKRETERIGLVINPVKTKYLMAGRKRGGPNGVDLDVEMDWIRFDVVDEFIYLGTLVLRLQVGLSTVYVAS